MDASSKDRGHFSEEEADWKAPCLAVDMEHSRQVGMNDRALLGALTDLSAVQHLEEAAADKDLCMVLRVRVCSLLCQTTCQRQDTIYQQAPALACLLLRAAADWEHSLIASIGCRGKALIREAVWKLRLNP